MRKCFRSATLAAGLFAACALSPVARAAVLVEFESNADITNNFNSTTAIDTTGTTGVNVTTSAPTIGTASLRAASDSVLTYKNAQFGLASGSQITLSIKFSKAGVTGTGAPAIQLGLTDTATNGFANTGSVATPGPASLYARVLPTGTGTANAGVFDVRYDNKLPASASAGEQTPASATGFLIDGTGNPFYLYTLTIQRTGASTFVQKGSLVKLAADNTTPASTVVSFTGTTQTNANLAANADADAGTLYAGFRNAGVSFGAFRMDQFAVSDVSTIPEPAALGGLAVIAGLAARRRRRA